MDPALDRDLQRWLVDLHAVERQAVMQLRAARLLVGDPRLAADLSRHLAETMRHRQRIAELLAERGRRGSLLRDAGATLNRLGFVLYTATGADAPGKLLADSIAYEHFEIAAYRILEQSARRAGDERLEAAAREIAGEEEQMAARLALRLQWAVDASSGRAAGSPSEWVMKHLRDVRALETQACVLLSLAARALEPPALSGYARAEHRRTRGQRSRLDARLRELGARPSPAKDAVMRTAGAGWAFVWSVQRARTAKLACFLYAERHLQTASYELLCREATRAGDRLTVALAAELLSEERAAAAALAELLPAAAQASPRA